MTLFESISSFYQEAASAFGSNARTSTSETPVARAEVKVYVATTIDDQNPRCHRVIWSPNASNNSRLTGERLRPLFTALSKVRHSPDAHRDDVSFYNETAEAVARVKSKLPGIDVECVTVHHPVCQRRGVSFLELRSRSTRCPDIFYDGSVYVGVPRETSFAFPGISV